MRRLSFFHRLENNESSFSKKFVYYDSGKWFSILDILFASAFTVPLISELELIAEDNDVPNICQ